MRMRCWEIVQVRRGCPKLGDASSNLLVHQQEHHQSQRDIAGLRSILDDHQLSSQSSNNKLVNRRKIFQRLL